ncbi:MAG TPA: hypothetical protein VJ834_00750 [Burkholderiales bacterium]|nr:hypothetical protein [Burkholderiales bacterium]
MSGSALRVVTSNRRHHTIGNGPQFARGMIYVAPAERRPALMDAVRRQFDGNSETRSRR